MTQLYDNARLLAPDGQIIGYCKNKKLEFYQKKGLGQIEEDKLGKFLKMNRWPNGVSGPEELRPVRTSLEYNRCVVCETIKNLTRHHVIPLCYYQWIPKQFKEHSRDLPILCETCHRLYEPHADKLKNELAIQFNAPLNLSTLDNNSRRFDLIDALSKWYFLFDIIREDKKAKIIKKIYGYLDLDVTKLSKEQTKDLIIKYLSEEIELDSHPIRVVKNVGSISEFMNMWRQHFVDHAKPKHWSF